MSGALALVKYETYLGEVELSPETVRNYLVNGNGRLTDQEVMMFINLCKYQRLNPFIREAYIIKFGDQPATIVTGKEVFTKRASRNPKYQGHTTGISDDGKRAWADVHVDGYKVPIRCEVDFAEYVGKKKDGTVNRQWADKPRTMLKKVALVQALREAFPEDFGGMYSPEEINTIDADALPVGEVKATVVQPRQKVSQVANLKDKLAPKEEPAIDTDPAIEAAFDAVYDQSPTITVAQAKDIAALCKKNKVSYESLINTFNVKGLLEIKECDLNSVYDFILGATKE